MGGKISIQFLQGVVPVVAVVIAKTPYYVRWRCYDERIRVGGPCKEHKRTSLCCGYLFRELPPSLQNASWCAETNLQL